MGGLGRVPWDPSGRDTGGAGGGAIRLTVSGALTDNGVISAKFLLPDAESGYYRGTRFDWSGQISSLKTKNHEYFGQWFERYDPKLHDAIMGPVEEFRTGSSGLGYDEAAVGGEFVRIGVGVLKKPEEKAFQSFRTYEILDAGKWSVKQGKDWIQFTHDLKGPNGYAYRYTKKIRLVKGQPQMVIEHALKNTGTKRIETSQYNHNFFVMDSQPTGPEASVKFPFELKAVREFQGEGNNITARKLTVVPYTPPDLRVISLQASVSIAK